MNERRMKMNSQANERRDRKVAENAPRGTGRPFFQVDSLGPFHVLLEGAFQLVGKLAVVNRHGDLEVEQQTARIEVGSADQRPTAVDHQRFRVHQPVFVLIDLDARL